MKIILDPSRDGCTVWFVGRNTVKFLKGNPQEVCEKLYKFCTCSYKNKYGAIITEQCVEIALDYMGIGFSYRDCLINSYGLTISLIKPEHELVI